MEITKICSKCHEDKILTDFNKRKNSKDGYRYECKLCQKSAYLNKREHYINKMKENRLLKIVEYRERDEIKYEKNKEEILIKKKEYYEKNRDSILEQKKEYNNTNKDKRKEYYQSWKDKNRDWLRNYMREYSAKYREENPHIFAWRNVIKSYLVRLNTKKDDKTIELLGYSADELKNHLESLFTDGMSWNNYGEWHIDHIKPLSSFEPDTPPSIVNALVNLQPLWATTREINGIIYEGNLNKNNNFTF